jgi:hypothetical protein
MITVKHSGAIGDIIYALPYVASLGNNIDFYVGEHTFVRGIPDQETPASTYGVINYMFPLSKDLTDPAYSNFKAIKTLLEAQPFIANVYPVTEPRTYDHDLDEFRRSWTDSQSIIETVNGHFKFTGYKREESFLHNIPVLSGYENTCVCARSPRAVGYDGEGRYTRMIKWIKQNKNPERFVFVGIQKEFEYFQTSIWEDVEFINTADFLAVASVINSCPYGIFNSSAPLAIAAALNKERYVENPMSYILNVILLFSKQERYF